MWRSHDFPAPVSPSPFYTVQIKTYMKKAPFLSSHPFVISRMPWSCKRSNAAYATQSLSPHRVPLYHLSDDLRGLLVRLKQLLALFALLLDAIVLVQQLLEQVLPV